MKNTQIERVKDFINQEVERAGYILVDIKIRGGRKLSLEVTVDKEGGITINECALLNRSIVSRVEKDDIHAEDFIIDVCSPGLDRELKSDSSFKWGMGKIVKVITGAEINGKTVIDGRLLEKTPEGDILIGRPDGTEVMIERNKVNKIKLVPEIK